MHQRLLTRPRGQQPRLWTSVHVRHRTGRSCHKQVPRSHSRSTSSGLPHPWHLSPHKRQRRRAPRPLLPCLRLSLRRRRWRVQSLSMQALANPGSSLPVRDESINLP